jgi:hypothetical protein
MVITPFDVDGELSNNLNVEGISEFQITGIFSVNPNLFPAGFLGLMA